MTETTAPAPTICPTCKGEVAADALKCRHCAEWLPGRSPAPTPGQAKARQSQTPQAKARQAEARHPEAPQAKAQWPKILAIVVGVIVAGFLLLVLLSVLAVTFLGTRANDKFSSIGGELGAPAAQVTPAPAFAD